MNYAILFNRSRQSSVEITVLRKDLPMIVSASRSLSLPAALPGLLLCAAVTLSAYLVEQLQMMVFGSH